MNTDELTPENLAAAREWIAYWRDEVNDPDERSLLDVAVLACAYLEDEGVRRANS